MHLVFMTCALLCGVVLTVQVGGNSLLGKALSDPYLATAVNMLVGLLATALLLLILHKPVPPAAQLRHVPVWTWLAGGCLGTVYLTANIVLAPRMGAAALVACVVTGQILFAVLADHYGWLGFTEHTVTPWRLAGCCLMVGGVALITRF